MGNTTNLRIGDCEVYFDKGDGNGERNLGFTQGGVEFTFEREFTDLTADEYGTTKIDMALTGQNLQIKVMLAEPTTENMGLAIPEATFSKLGTDSKLELGQKSGALLSAYAGMLRLHPRKNSASNRNEDIFIFKAVSTETVTLPFKVDEQRILEITFTALVDESQPEVGRLGRIGDYAIS